MAQANKFCCRRDVRIYYNIIHTGTIIYGIPSTKSPPVVYRKPNWPGPACSPLTRFYQTIWGGVGWWCGRAILWSPPSPDSTRPVPRILTHHHHDRGYFHERVQYRTGTSMIQSYLPTYLPHSILTISFATGKKHWVSSPHTHTQA